MQDARTVAEKGGWISVRHLGKHYCKSCGVPISDHSQHEPKRTWDTFRAEQWAAKREKLKILLTMRRKGKTLRECGEALGVSAERARGLLKQAEHSESVGWGQPGQKKPLQAEFDPMTTPIDHYDFSVRTVNCLRNANVTTLVQVSQMSDAELLSINNLGRNSLNEIRAMQKLMLG